MFTGLAVLGIDLVMNRGGMVYLLLGYLAMTKLMLGRVEPRRPREPPPKKTPKSEKILKKTDHNDFEMDVFPFLPRNINFVLILVFWGVSTGRVGCVHHSRNLGFSPNEGSECSSVKHIPMFCMCSNFYPSNSTKSRSLIKLICLLLESCLSVMEEGLGPGGELQVLIAALKALLLDGMRVAGDCSPKYHHQLACPVRGLGGGVSQDSVLLRSPRVWH
eukprot:4347817-Amphidinium_carterae.1